MGGARILSVLCWVAAAMAMPAGAATITDPVQILAGHTDSVPSLAYGPDGERIVTGSNDQTSKLWDAATGEAIRSFEGHTDTIWSVAFSPDGEKVLTGSADSTARLWDAATGEKIRSFEGHADGVWGVAFSPDGQHVLTGSGDNSAKLWDVATGQEIRTFQGHSAGVASVAFSPDGQHVLTGAYDETAKLWDTATGREIRTFRGHRDFVVSVAFSADGKQILTGSGDTSAKLWDVATGQEIRSFDQHSDSVWSVAFSPGGGHVLTGSGDNTARLWEVASGEVTRTFAEHPGKVYAVAFSPAGQRALVGVSAGTAMLWKTGLKPRQMAENATTADAEQTDASGAATDAASAADASSGEPASSSASTTALADKVAALEAVPTDKSRHLFAIGITDYQDAQDVAFAERSTKLAVEAMQKRLGIPEVNSTVLTGREATGTRIAAMINVFLNRIDPGDRIYFYYAGHGAPARDGSGSYILGSDAIIKSYQFPQLSLQNIYQRFKKSKAKQVVAFIDACFSGRTDGNELVFDDQDVAPFTKASNVEAPEDVTVFTAGANDQFATSYRDKKHRLFSYYLIDGLVAGRDDLASYVRERVYEHSRRNGPTYTQKPQLQGDLVLPQLSAR